MCKKKTSAHHRRAAYVRGKIYSSRDEVCSNLQSRKILISVGLLDMRAYIYSDRRPSVGGGIFDPESPLLIVSLPQHGLSPSLSLSSGGRARKGVIDFVYATGI